MKERKLQQNLFIARN
jgi:hypothetical protein